MKTYPRKFEYTANIDENAPYFIERNEDYTAFRCCNRYYEILSYSVDKEQWFQMPLEIWNVLTSMCNEKTGWYLQGNCIFLYGYTESEILSSKGYKIIPIIEKQIKLLSECFDGKYALSYFEYAIGKSFPNSYSK